MAIQNKGSLDTNLLLRLLLDDVPAQTKMIDALLAKGGRFHIADAALFEMIFVLEKIYKMNRDLIVENVLGIVHNKQFVCNTRLFVRVMPLYNNQPKLSIIDCALLEYARLQSATPLYTYDKQLIKASEKDSCTP